MPDTGKTTRRYLIAGRVQGVYYRQSCREQALKLDLRGWVRNLDDGRVEAVAVGSAAALSEFEEWLWEGPPAALVERVENEPAEYLGWRSFDIIA